MNERKSKRMRLQYEESVLQLALQMTRTASGLPICPDVSQGLMTCAQRQEFIRSLDTMISLSSAMVEPFNEFTKISDNLYLTGAGGMIEDNISQYKINCIINVSYELPALQISGIQFYRIPIEDFCGTDLKLYFDEVSDEISKWNQNNRNFVIYCINGISRSPTIVLAHLMKSRRMSLRNAFQYVLERRSVIRPNISAFKQLIDYEKSLFGTNSVHMVERIIDSFGNRHTIPDIYPIREYTHNFY